MRDFTEGNITKQMLLFSMPMLIGNLFQQLYSIVDAVVVGQFVGGHALAAVGVSMNVTIFLTSMLIGLTMGSAVLIAQFFGAKQYDRLKKAVSVSVLFLAGLSVLLTVLGFVLAPQLLNLLDAPAEIFDYALTYLRIVMAGMVFPIFFNMYTAYMRALGDARRPLYILIAASVFNMGLTLFFVAVLEWGVAGAAASTIISQMGAAVLSYIYARRTAPLLRVEKLMFEPEMFRAILRYGAPAALQLSLVSFAGLTITRLINSFGSAAMAGITAVSRIDQFANMPVANLSMALSTFVAQNMGAGIEDRAKKGFRIALICMLIFSVLISAVLMIFSTPLISLFLDPTDANAEEILSIGQSYLNILVIFYFLFAFLFGFNGFFRGVGDAVIAMAFPVLSLTIRVVAAYALVYLAGMGPEALAWSIPIGWGLSSLASWIYYKKRLWVGKVAV